MTVRGITSNTIMIDIIRLYQAEVFSQDSLTHFLWWENGLIVHVVVMNLRSVITDVCAHTGRRNEQIKAQVLC